MTCLVIHYGHSQLFVYFYLLNPQNIDAESDISAQQNL